MTERAPIVAVSRANIRDSGAMARAIWSMLDAAASPVSGLVTLAVLVRSLGPSDYGILVIALAAAGLSLVLSPAIAATTTKFVSECSVRADSPRHAVARVVTVALAAVSVIDAAILVIVALFSQPLASWVFGVANASMPNMGLMLWLAVLSMSAQQIDAVLAGAIRGFERFRRQAMLEMLSRAMLTVIVTYVAWRSRSLIMILGAQCVVYLISTLVRAEALRRLLPDGRLFERPHYAEAAMLIRYSGWMGLTALAGVVYTSFDRILVGRTLGSAAAGEYNIYLQLTQLIHFVPGSLFAFALPVFSRVAALGDVRHDEITRTYRAYLLGVAITAIAVAAAIAVSWPQLLSLLAVADFGSDQRELLGILSLNFLLLAFNVAPYYLLLAFGRARVVAIITTVSMMVALILMWVLIPRYGLKGAAAARLAFGIGGMALLKSARTMLQRR